MYDSVQYRSSQFPGTSVRLYFFDLRGPAERRDDDREGTLFASDCDALNFANRIIRELKEAGGYDDPGLSMIVRDAAHKTLQSIPFTNAPLLHSMSDF